MSDPLFDRVVALLQMDGAYDGTTFTDVKGHTVTRGGSTLIKTNQKKYGTASAFFDGSGDYLSINHADVNISTGDGCFEAWCYFESAPTVGHGIFTWGAPATSNANRIQFAVTPALAISLYFEDAAAQSNSLYSADGVIPLCEWVHVAAVFRGSACRIYINGTMVTGTVYDNAVEVTGANSVLRRSYTVAAGNIMYLGTHRSANAQAWARCYIDSARVTKGHPRYVEDFTPGPFDEYRLFVPSKISEQLALSAWTLRTARADTGALLASVNVSNGVSEAPPGTGTSEYSGPVMVRCQPQIDGIFSYDQAYPEGAIVVPDRPISNPVAYRRNPAPTGDPYWSEVVALLHFDGTDGSTTFTDEKGHTVARGGNNTAVIETEASVFGESCVKLSAGDAIVVTPSGSEFDIQWADFTMEAWIRPTSLPAPSLNYMIAGIWQNPYRWFWGLYNLSGTMQMVFWYYASSTGIYTKVANIPLPFHTNRWYHVAVTKWIGYLRFYIDGIKFYDSGSSNFTIDSSGTTALNIGGNTGSVGHTLLGYIDDFRFTMNIPRHIWGTLSVPTRAHPHAAPTRNADYATLYVQGEGANNGATFPDLLVNGITRSGDTKTSEALPYLGRASAYFDGVGDNLYIPAQGGVNVLQRNFTIEGWFNFDTFPIASANAHLFGSWNVTSTNCAMLWTIYNNAGTYQMRLHWRTTGSTLVYVGVNFSAAPVCGQWYHMAVCRSGTTLRFFLDGAQLGADQTMNVTVPYGLVSWEIGSAGAASYFKGFMKELTFYRDYAKYTTGFTPPDSFRADDPATWSDTEDEEIEDGPYVWTCIGRIPRPVDQGPIQPAQKWEPGVTVGVGTHVVPTDLSSTARVYRATSYVDEYAGRDLMLIPFDGANDTPDFYDVTRQQTLVVRGQPVVKTATKKYGSASGFFDGTDDTILLPAGADWDFGYGDFTIEAWIWIATGSSGPRQIMDKFTTWTSDVDFCFEVNSGGYLGFYAGDSVPISLFSNSVLNTAQWYHVAVCRAGGTTRTFVDGVAQTSTHTGAVNIPNGKTVVAIGSNSYGANYWNGYLDDLRVTKGVARYVSNFTPPDGTLYWRQTGETEPTWPTVEGDTVEDGGVVWTCVGQYY